MMHGFKILSTVLAVGVAVLCSCEFDLDPAPVSEFSNKLQIGTGLNASNPFELAGQGAMFSGVKPLTLTFRLESADDMLGSAVVMDIEKNSGIAYEPYATQTYPNPQSSGHIFLASFSIADAGSYRATGILQKGSKSVGSAVFTVR
jgi:hypothetical protein